MFKGMFGAAAAAVKNTKVVARLGGKDELQAIVAASVLVAFAPGPNGEPGNVDAAERGQIVDSLWNNEAIRTGFSQAEISSLITDYVDAVKAGAFSGKRRLKKELEDVGGKPDVAERVWLVALDVASQGGISPQEKEILVNDIAPILRQNPSEYF